MNPSVRIYRYKRNIVICDIVITGYYCNLIVAREWYNRRLVTNASCRYVYPTRPVFGRMTNMCRYCTVHPPRPRLVRRIVDGHNFSSFECPIKLLRLTWLWVAWTPRRRDRTKLVVWSAETEVRWSNLIPISGRGPGRNARHFSLNFLGSFSKGR